MKYLIFVFLALIDPDQPNMEKDILHPQYPVILPKKLKLISDIDPRAFLLIYLKKILMTHVWTSLLVSLLFGFENRETAMLSTHVCCQTLLPKKLKPLSDIDLSHPKSPPHHPPLLALGHDL